jgi:uncharacterized protein YkwD
VILQVAALVVAIFAVAAVLAVPDLRCALGLPADSCEQPAPPTDTPVRIATTTDTPPPSPIAPEPIAPDTPGPGRSQKDDATAQANAMVSLTNEARSQAGLEPYRVNEILSGAAQAHADEIVSSGVFSHTGADGRNARERVLGAGYGAGREGVRVGENFVARATVEEAFQWLMDDPQHRDNILHPVYREIGVGVGETSFGYVWVMDLGTYDGVDDAATDGR